jgi:hypothetical protein
VERVSGLGLDRVAQATTKGLRLASGLPFTTWRRLGEQISVIQNASAWWIGDWLSYGERRYGAGYREAMSIFGLEYQTLRNYAWVATKFPLYRRRDGLSFQHHAEVASLTEGQQELWLHQAATSKWSRNELRRHLRVSRQVQRKAAAVEPVVLRVRVSAERECRWRAAAEEQGADLEHWITLELDRAAEIALQATARVSA